LPFIFSILPICRLKQRLRGEIFVAFLAIIRPTAPFDYTQGKLKINDSPAFPRLREDKFAHSCLPAGRYNATM